MTPSREAACVFLKKGKDDQYVLERLVDDPGAPLWTAGFHAQQAVEKALKAVLTSMGIEFPRTHNLAMLVALLRQHAIDVPTEAEQYFLLTPFGVAFRYDDFQEEDGAALDREWASKCVRQAISWADYLLHAEDERQMDGQ
jgi:HEPN domain-containing protein